MIKRKYITLLLEWYDYRIHRGVTKVARNFGWQLIYRKDPVANEAALQRWQSDGCIALLKTRKTVEYFKTHRIPLVDLGLGEHGLPALRVVTDNREIGRLAAEHFHDQGYREVFALSPGNVTMYRERLAAMQEFMKKQGGFVTVLQSTDVRMAVVLEELRAIARKRKHRLEELSIAFFAYEDTLAADLIALCLQNQLRIPENMAVLGVDNDDLINAGMTVGLSSVDSDLEGLGMLAAFKLSNLLQHPGMAARQEIIRHPPRQVVVRRSTDCYAVHNPLVSEALHWIHNNFHKGIHATDVADAMGVTQQGLQKAFAADYTRSPGQEIRCQRIQAVADLLGRTNAQLEDIARHCGFTSSNTLIKSFRTIYNTTPGVYRKQMHAERKA